MTTVRELILDNAAGGFYGRGSTFATHPDTPVVDVVQRIAGNRVDFICRFENQALLYRVLAPARRTAEELARTLSENRGKTLGSLGGIELTEG
jgi:hypothetical protein